MIDPWIFLLTAIMIGLFILDVATKGKYRSRKLRLLLLISGMVFGICLVHGILRVSDPKLLFDLMTLLTMIYLFVRGRQEGSTESGVGVIDRLISIRKGNTLPLSMV